MGREQPLGELVLAIDPGHHKWGLAVVSSQGECIERCVVPIEEGLATLCRLLDLYPCRRFAVGNATGSETVLQLLHQHYRDKEIVLIEEKETSLKARDLYFQYHPPQGWRRLIPRGLLTPPEPLDSYAAEIIARRYWVQHPPKLDRG